MKQLEGRQKLLVATSVLVAILFVYFKFLLFPLFGKFKQLGETAGRYRRELAVTEKVLGRMDQVKKEIARLEGLVGEKQRYFPSERELPVLLEEFSDVAEAAGVKILEMKPGKGRPPVFSQGQTLQDLRELPITITALSGYHEFGSFVNALENSERIYLLQDISIRSSPENERLHSVKVVLSVFLQGEGSIP